MVAQKEQLDRQISTGVTVTAPSRLHCGLINLGGHFGRVDGGVGFALADPCVRVHAEFSEVDMTSGQSLDSEQQAAVANVLARFSSILNGRRVHLDFRSLIDQHSGLGSKTALCLAVGKALCLLSGTAMDSSEISALVGRGGTSGIGSHALDRGGFLWDAGHSYPDEKASFLPSSATRNARPPKLLLHDSADWLQIVHFRFDRYGLSGQEETGFWNRVCPFGERDTVNILSHIAFGVVPALLDRKMEALQDSLALLQEFGIKRAEWEIQSALTKEFRKFWVSQQTGYALGLSSMGPTLYCVTTEPDKISEIVSSFGVEPVHLTTTGCFRAGLE